MCECSLTAAYDYQINKANLQCKGDIQPDSEFITYFAHNQAILDILNSSFNIEITKQMTDQIGTLTVNVLRFNLPELQWYENSKEDMPSIYDSSVPVIDVELVRFLEDVSDQIEDYGYTDIEEWVIAQRQFANYMKEGEWWQRMQFVTAILGTLCWIVAIAICCCYKKLIITTILSSQRLEEFELIKTIPPGVDAAATLQPHIEPILTLFPPEAKDDNLPLSPQAIISIIAMLIIVVVCLLMCCSLYLEKV